MSGAPEPTHDQKADPQHGEPREMLVKHPAPWKRSVEWEARIPVSFWNVEWRGNRRVGTGEEGYVFVGGGRLELSHVNCGTTMSATRRGRCYNIAMPSRPTSPPADRAYWTRRLEAAQREVKQLRERIEEHRRSSRPNLYLLQVWRASLAHWQSAEAEARRQIALFPAGPEALHELSWMKV